MSYYLKQTYHAKVAKVPLNAGFTCPNRDGTKSTGGCTFCSAMGSGQDIIRGIPAFGYPTKCRAVPPGGCLWRVSCLPVPRTWPGTMFRQNKVVHVSVARLTEIVYALPYTCI